MKLSVSAQTKQFILHELQRLINLDSVRNTEYFQGRVDAFSAIWKIFENTYHETDYSENSLIDEIEII